MGIRTQILEAENPIGVGQHLLWCLHAAQRIGYVGHGRLGRVNYERLLRSRATHHVQTLGRLYVYKVWAERKDAHLHIMATRVVSDLLVAKELLLNAHGRWGAVVMDCVHLKVGQDIWNFHLFALSERWNVRSSFRHLFETKNNI